MEIQMDSPDRQIDTHRRADRLNVRTIELSGQICRLTSLVLCRHGPFRRNIVVLVWSGAVFDGCPSKVEKCRQPTCLCRVGTPDSADLRWWCLLACLCC